MKKYYVLLGIVAAASAAWTATAPPDHIQIPPPLRLGEPSPQILGAKAPGDFIAEHLSVTAPEMPGHDTVALMEERGLAFLSGMDGWVWKVELASGRAERFADLPLMPAGVQHVPGAPDKLYFCASRLHGQTYPPGDQVGVYELDVATKAVRPVLTRVPLPPTVSTVPEGREGVLYPLERTEPLRLADMTEANSRPLAFCNDLAVHSSGKRLYFSEPFDYEGASMGQGAFREAVSLGRHGKLWLYDAERDAVSLVAQKYTFIDGVLIEERPEGVEHSVLVTETVKFRMLRLFVSGPRAGEDEVVWDSLPGLPDGMSRDAQGRIWVGLLKKRSPFATWGHANPWIKPLLLRLPRSMMPIPTQTGVLVLSPDAARPLLFTEHEGAQDGMKAISSIAPGKDAVYLANFDLGSRGVFRVPYPEPLR